MFIGGLGSGKSTVAGFWTRDRFCVPGSVGLIIAGTREQLRDATLPRIKEAWEWLGIYEGEHYVIGVKPPASWGVRPWHGPNSANIVTFRWGAYAKIGSVERFNALRGGEYDWIVGDEWRDWKDKAVDVLIGRLRGKTFGKLGRLQQMLLLTSPPDDPDFVRRYFSSTEVDVIRCTTYDNEANLPEGYIDAQAALLDDLTFDREILGILISSAGTAAYYKYDEELSRSRQTFDPRRELWLAWDFNSGNKPMACILIQRDDEGRAHAVKELVLKQSNTEKTALAVVAFLESEGYDFSDSEFRRRVNVTGDYAGHQRRSSASRTDYQIIREILNGGGYETPQEKTRPTHRVTDRVGNTNWLFCSIRGERRLFVNPDTCPKLHADLLAVQWDDSGVNLDDSLDERTHPSDALSYYPYNYHRMGAVEPTIGNA